MSDAVHPQSLRTKVISSCLFFMLLLAGGAYIPYEIIWLSRIGLTGEQRGLAATLGTLGSTLAPLIMNPLADATGMHTSVAFVASGIRILLVNLYAPLRSLTWVQMALVAAMGLLENTGLLMAIVSRSLSHVGEADFLPRARSFGSLVWALVGSVFGWFQGRFGVPALFTLIFSPVLGLSAALVFLLPVREAYAEASNGRDENAVEPDKPFTERLKATLDWSALKFYLYAVLAGMHQGLFIVLGFVYVDAELHATGSQLGLYVFTTSIMEFFVFLISASVVKRLGGLMPAMYFINLVGFVRFGVGYYCADGIWQLLPFEPLNAVQYCIYFTVVAEFAERYTRDGLQATIFGLLAASYSVGQAIAALLSGFTSEAFGMRSTFGFFGAIFLLAALPGLFDRGGASKVRVPELYTSLSAEASPEPLPSPSPLIPLRMVRQHTWWLPPTPASPTRAPSVSRSQTW